MAVSDEEFRALTARVEELERQGRAWVHLDRDVAALQAQRQADRRVLNAIAETQADHGRLLTDHTRLLTDHTRRLDGLERKVDGLERKVDEGFAATTRSLTQIIAMLDSLTA